jgi:hypothetical protein
MEKLDSWRGIEPCFRNLALDSLVAREAFTLVLPVSFCLSCSCLSSLGDPEQMRKA